MPGLELIGPCQVTYSWGDDVIMPEQTTGRRIDKTTLEYGVTGHTCNTSVSINGLFSMARTDLEKRGSDRPSRRWARPRSTSWLFLFVLLSFTLSAWLFFSCGLPGLYQPHQRP